MIIWRLITNVMLTSLLAGLAVFLIAVLLGTNKQIYKIFLNRKRTIILFLILLILFMPLVLSVFRGAWLSPREAGIYVRELLISTVIVASFGITWKLLNQTPVLRSSRSPIKDPSSLERNTSEVFVKSEHPTNQLNITSQESHIEIPSLNEALQAWDRNEITQDKVEEIQVLESLNKWIEEGNETGWYELQEDIGPNKKLQYPEACFIVKRELQRVHRERHRNGNYQKQLESILPDQLMVK